MDHSPIIRDTHNTKVAVLMVHGFAGTPAHFHPLVPAIPEDWTLHNIILEGHDKSVKDFGASSLKKWRQQAMDEARLLLETHEKLVVVGHSMGTLFALRIALAHPGRIPFLFLLNLPTRPRATLSTIRTCLQTMAGKTPTDIVTARHMQEDTAMVLESGFIKYAGWFSRLLELMVEISQVRRLLPQLPVETYVYQSKRDELVSPRAFRDLQKNPRITTIPLAHSGHFHYDTRDAEAMQTHLKQLLQTL